MILFYIKAKLNIAIRGISGFTQEGVSVMTRAQNRDIAKMKFEAHCHERFKHLGFESINFEYLEIAYEI